jgi:hypothetical protein
MPISKMPGTGIELLGSATVRRAVAELADILSGRSGLGKVLEALSWPLAPSRLSVVADSARKFRRYEDAGLARETSW